MSCDGSLAARIMWRIQKDTGLVSDAQLTTLDLLEDHLSKMTPEDLKELKVDVQHFYSYWPKKSKVVGEDYVSHIFGVVGRDSSLLHLRCSAPQDEKDVCIVLRSTAMASR